MTLPNILPTKTYQTNGTTKEWSLAFPLNEDDTLTVTITDRGTSPNTPTPVDADDYSIEYTPDGIDTKAIVTYPKTGSAIASGYYLTFERTVPLSQLQSFSNQGRYFQEKMELALDKSMKAIQQLSVLIGRCVLHPVGSIDSDEDYLTQLQNIMIEARDAVDTIQGLLAGVPTLPFNDIFLITASTFTLLESHNGQICVVDVPSGGSVLTLPDSTTLSGRYLVWVKLNSGTDSILVNRSGADLIDGATSFTIDTVGETVCFAVDLDGATANQWFTVGGSKDNTLDGEKLKDGTVDVDKLKYTFSDKAFDVDAGTSTIKGKFPFYDVGAYSSSPVALGDTHIQSLMRVDASGGTMELNLPAIDTDLVPYTVAIKRTAGVSPINVNPDGTDEIDGVNATYVMPVGIGDTVLFTADAVGSTANEWTSISMPAKVRLPQHVGGRLTAVSGNPNPDLGVNPSGYNGSTTTLYYTPYVNNLLSVYDATDGRWHEIPFTEKTVAVPATSNTVYDVYAEYVTPTNFTLALVAWSSSTIRATGHTKQDGVLCQTGNLSRRYLGTVATMGTSGTLLDNPAQRSIWNFYNKIMRPCVVFDATASWSYTTSSWRQANGASANKIELVSGYDEALSATITGRCSGASASVYIGVGRTTGTPDANALLTNSATGTATTHLKVGYGYRTLYMIEYGGTGATFYGSASLSALGFCGLQANLLM